MSSSLFKDTGYTELCEPQKPNFSINNDPHFNFTILDFPFPVHKIKWKQYYPNQNSNL